MFFFFSESVFALFRRVSKLPFSSIYGPRFLICSLSSGPRLTPYLKGRRLLLLSPPRTIRSTPYFLPPLMHPHCAEEVANDYLSPGQPEKFSDFPP